MVWSLRRFILALLVVVIVFLVILFLTTVLAPVFAGLPLIPAVAAFFAQWNVVISVIIGGIWYFSGATFFGRA